MLARVMPGLGNPLTQLDIWDFNEFLGKVNEVLQLESGETDMREQVRTDSGL